MRIHEEKPRAIRSILRYYADLVDPLSLDESYLDVTDPKAGPPSGTLIARRMRRASRAVRNGGKRTVRPDQTFREGVSDPDEMLGRLERIAETVARRFEAAGPSSALPGNP